MTVMATTVRVSLEAVVSAAGLTKVYGSGETRVPRLDGVRRLHPRRVHRDHGPIRVGKSTLMHCLAGLDTRPRARCGSASTELTGLSDKQMTQLRRDRIGFVFQAFNLVPTLTALENITLPLDIAGRKVDREWLDNVVGRSACRPAAPPPRRTVRRTAATRRLRPCARQPARR